MLTDQAEQPRSRKPSAHWFCLPFSIPSHLLPWGRGSNKNLQLAEANTSATGRRPQSEEGSWVVLKIFAPFHLGLILAVSGKFYGSLREEAADEAKKTRLGLSLLSMLGPLPEAPRLEGRMGGRP